MSACRSRGVPRLGRTRIGFTFGLSARAGAGGHGATLGHAPAPRGGYSGQCAKPLRMATRDPTLDQRAHLLGSPSLNNARALSGAGKRTAASGVAWSGCASLRGPLCAGEALLEARTQASVALFKLGAHSATLRPEFGGPKSLRCCCAKGVGHRAQLMLRARRGDRENNHPVPLLRTPTNTS